MQTSSIEQRAPSGNALAFEESVEVPAPVAEVYRLWTDFSHFPAFMSHVEAVRPLGGGKYHWVVRVLGAKREWDAEVTDQQENQRISWRSINGVPNAGTVSLQPLPNNQTRIQLRLEYTPPGGPVGQQLEKLSQITRREVREDLENFRRMISGEKKKAESSDIPDAATIATALAFPLVAGAVGGTVAYFVERDREPPKALLPGRNPKQKNPVSRPATIASWALAGASDASIIVSAVLRMRGDRNTALFVGQWAPTLLGAGILARLIGHGGVKPTLESSITSWACVGASAGSILGSLFTHLRSTRYDGLYVGQWAPTLLSWGLVNQLVNRT